MGNLYNKLNKALGGKAIRIGGFKECVSLLEIEAKCCVPVKRKEMIDISEQVYFVEKGLLCRKSKDGKYIQSFYQPGDVIYSKTSSANIPLAYSVQDTLKAWYGASRWSG